VPEAAPPAGRILLWAGLAAWGTPAAAAAPSPEAIEEAVREVFSDPALREGLESAHGVQERLFLRLFEGLMKLYFEALEFLYRLNQESPLLFWSLFAGLALLLAAILLHLGWTFSRALRGGTRRGGGEDAAGAAARARRFRDLREEARQAARSGRWGPAVRSLLLALLAHQEEARLLKVAMAWTNREILSRIHRPDLSGDLKAFTGELERICYGGFPVGAAEFRSLDDLMQRIADKLQ
jgi:hypothetical protein